MLRLPTPLTNPSWMPCLPRLWPEKFTLTAWRPLWSLMVTSAPAGPLILLRAPALPPILAPLQLPPLMAACKALHHREWPPGAPLGQIQSRPREGLRTEKLGRKKNLLRAPERMHQGAYFLAHYTIMTFTTIWLSVSENLIISTHHLLHPVHDHCIWNITDKILMLESGCQCSLEENS